MQHFKTLSAYLEYLELPRPEHPMLSVFSAIGKGFLPCPKESSPPITNDCYTISFKKIVKGDLNYGRTKYDFTNGALFFIAPRQVLQWDNSIVFEQRVFLSTFMKILSRERSWPIKLKSMDFFPIRSMRHFTFPLGKKSRLNQLWRILTWNTKTIRMNLAKK